MSLNSVPINVGTIIEWKPKGQSIILHKTVPINVGTIIEWKPASNQLLKSARVVPINVGTIIEWKQIQPTCNPI